MGGNILAGCYKCFIRQPCFFQYKKLLVYLGFLFAEFTGFLVVRSINFANMLPQEIPKI